MRGAARIIGDLVLDPTGVVLLLLAGLVALGLSL